MKLSLNNTVPLLNFFCNNRLFRVRLFKCIEIDIEFIVDLEQ